MSINKKEAKTSLNENIFIPNNELLKKSYEQLIERLIEIYNKFTHINFISEEEEFKVYPMLEIIKNIEHKAENDTLYANLNRPISINNLFFAGEEFGDPFALGNYPNSKGYELVAFINLIDQRNYVFIENYQNYLQQSLANIRNDDLPY
jgi:hypothetical protein